ncbi:MAG: hypothetical protein NVV82_02290 [Sporocytophaga sp.]|nr:hypothetical protein [Sporocytophaga sp.]
MSDNSRRPILYNGELYSSPISKGSSGPTKEPYVSFEVAREKVLSDLSFTKEKLRSIPSKSKLPNEAIICIRMQSEFSAKSYYPDSLFDNVKTKYGLKEIGSRIWKSIDEANVETGKLFFVRTTEDAISNFEDILSKEINITKKFSTDIRKISSIDILLPSEQVLGIGDDWAQGRLEAVLHPFNIDKDYALPHFWILLIHREEILER